MEPRARGGLGRGRAGRRLPRARARARAARGAPARRRPHEVKERLRGARRPLHRRQGDPHAPGRRAVGLPGLLAPGRHRPRHRPHAGRADRASSACATAASRARTWSTTPSRSRSPRPACPCSRSTPTRSTASWGCAWRAPGERLAGVRPLSARQLVVADDARPVAMVLGEVAHDAGVTWDTERMTLCALRVKGVPPIAVEEALWMAAETLYT